MISVGDIRTELDRITTAQSFARSERLREFLRFVVEETLAGRSGNLSAYTVGMSVFRLGEEFRPGDSSIVRVEALRLRQALERHYLTDGQTDPVRIDVPKGRYVPVFTAHPDPQRPARRLTEDPAASGETSVSICAFESLTNDTDQRPLAAAMTEEVRVALGHYRSVEVMSGEGSTPNSAIKTLSAREHSRGARFVLTGSVRRTGNHLRVTVCLSNTVTETDSWTQAYSRDLTPDTLFAVQAEIATQVAASVDRIVSSRPVGDRASATLHNHESGESI